MKLMIDVEECIGCGQCKSVCIRDNIEIDEVAFETGSNCFECGHCMAICPTKAITLKIFKGRENRIVEYNPNEIPVDYDDLLDFLKQRRSMRWFKKKKIDNDTFNKLIEGAYYSPSAQNQQDVEFVVLDKKLNDFMKHVYDIIKVEEEEFFRIKEFGDYLRDNSIKEYHPLLWSGHQLILTFSSDKTSAVIANTRMELMEFFPNIDKNKHMYSAFIIGYPKKRFRRTIPHKEINVNYM